MKKILFASTALVAAGMLTTGTASASDKINLSIGGFSKWWVVGAWQSSDYQQGNQVGSNARSYNNVDVKGDNEIWFSGDTKLDNGMKVGVSVHLEAGGHTDGTTDTIDQSYVYVEGGFGKVLAGTIKNGTYLMHVQAPDAAGNWGAAGLMTMNYVIAKPKSVNAMAGGNTTQINSNNNAETITYVAPTFYGLTVGASYLPNGVEDSRGVTDLNNEAASYVQEGYGAAAMYAETFGAVGVKLSAGVFQAKVNSSTISTTGVGGWLESSYGANLTYAGFTLGGSYRHQDSNCTKDLGNSNGCNGAAAGEATTTGNGSYGKGNAYDVGLSYASGPYAVSFAYFHSGVQHDNATGTTLGGDDTIEFYQASGKYNLGAGVDILTSVGYAKYNSQIPSTANGTTGDNNHNSGWMIMSGLSLTF